MDLSFNKQIIEEKRYGKNVIRIPFEISGNHDDYICFYEPRHTRIVKYFIKENPYYESSCAEYDSCLFHFGEYIPNFYPTRTKEHWYCTHLLGWNDGEHWGERYFHEDGSDKTDQLHHLITSNHPFDLFKGVMSDIKESLYDVRYFKNSI